MDDKVRPYLKEECNERAWTVWHRPVCRYCFGGAGQPLRNPGQQAMLLGSYGRALPGRDRDAVEGLGTLESVDD